MNTPLLCCLSSIIIALLSPISAAEQVAEIPRLEVDNIKIVEREEWGALLVPEELIEQKEVRYILIDDSARMPIAGATVLDQLQALQVYGVEVLGCGDIPYHYIISEDGTVYRGRERNTLFPGLQEGALTVLLLGDFSRELPAAAQLATLIKGLRALQDIHHIPSQRILSMAERIDRSGPGARLQLWLQQFRKQ